MVSGESTCKGTEIERSWESLSHPAEAKVEEIGTEMVDKEQCGGRGTLFYQDAGMEATSQLLIPRRGSGQSLGCYAVFFVC